jgi:hypothetical protein
MSDEAASDRDLAWFKEHQPKKLVGDPESGKLCAECNVVLAPAPLKYHKENAHAFLKCPICGGNIRRWDITVGQGKLCSITCQLRVYKENLCHECFKKPKTAYSWCDDCRKKYGARSAARHDFFRSVRSDSSKSLPKPYRREDAPQD